MAKNLRKLLALLMTLTMLAAMLPASALAEAAEANVEATSAPEAVVEEAAEEPTEVPTAEPTAEPTQAPAEEPTEAPTEEPAEVPTEEPTEEPAEEPTAEPTEEITEAPTEAPTGEPAEEATEEPWFEPTIEPTLEPDVQGTAEPVQPPVGDPGAEPSVSPTPEPTPEAPAAYLTLSGKAEITVGKSATFSVKTETGAKVKAANLSWSSSDTAVATVKAGVVTARAEGFVTITATAKNGRTGSVDIEILPKATGVVIMMNGEELPNKHSHIANVTEGKTLQLAAKTLPEKASQAVAWKSGNTKVARVNADGLVSFVGFGTANLIATARDGSGKLASVSITVRRFVTEIKISGKDFVASGKQTTLKAAAAPANATVKSVAWTSSDENVAVINAKGVLTAKAVEVPTPVTITASAKDGSGVIGEHVITVYPLASGVEILRDGEDAGASLIMDYASKELRLSARVLSENAYQGVSWKSGDARIARVNADGIVTAVKPGKVTIAATAQDGSGKRDLITITIRRFASQIKISGKDFVASGKQTTLKAAVTPTNATLKTVQWTSSNPDVAAVNAKGIVTAKAVEVPTPVTITASAKDGSGVVGEHVITVYPIASGVEILRDGEDAGKSFIMDYAAKELRLSTRVLSENAYQGVSWKSSNARIVKVSADGLVTAVKPGSATITATAQDGSGKRDTIAITVRRFVTEIKVSGKEMLASGKQTTLKATVYPANATLRTVSWVSSNPDAAVVNAKGIVTAKAVTEPTPVTITAAARDGSEVVGAHAVWIYPAATAVEIRLNGQDAGKTAVIDFVNNPSLTLTAATLPENAYQGVSWKSSDSRIATVENGVISAKKPGTVTITAAAQDGTGRKDVITVYVRRLVTEIKVSGTASVIAPGRTKTLKVVVSPTNATLKAVQWSSSDPTVATVNAKGVVTAANGLNRITPVTITATAKDGSGVYGEFEVYVGKDSVVYRALLIGNTYPGTTDELPGPDNDVQGMKKMLGRQTKTKYDVTVRENLSASGMESAIYDAFEYADANDVSLFYFSGHGTSSGSLLGVGGSSVSVDDLRSYLDKVPGTKIVLLDSCYSGAYVNRSAYSRSAAPAVEAVSADDLDSFNDAVISTFSSPAKRSAYARGNLRSNGYYVMTACRKDQQSYSHPFWNEDESEEELFYCGAFTYALCKGSGWDMEFEENCNFFADTNRAEGDSNGKIDFFEAYRYAYSIALDLTLGSQSAQYYCGDDFDNQYVLWSYK